MQAPFSSALRQAAARPKPAAAAMASLRRHRGGAAAAGGGKTAFRVLHNASGVEGLHIALNVFDEEYERRLMFMRRQDAPTSVNQLLRMAFDWSAGERSWPPELFQIVNAVRDCGLFPGLQTPNAGHTMSYLPAGARRQSTGEMKANREMTLPGELIPHYDAEGDFGETIVGVSLGAPCVLVMVPDKRDFPGKVHRTEIFLPRRSVYVFSGRARYEPGYKPGIEAVGSCGRFALQAAEPRPSWNPEGVRRSITLRSTMGYAQAMLRHELKSCPPGQKASLQGRLARLERLQGRQAFCSVVPTAPWSGPELQPALRMLRSFAAQGRIPAQHALFLRFLPAEVAQLYQTQQTQSWQDVEASELRQRRLAALDQGPSLPQQSSTGSQQVDVSELRRRRLAALGQQPSAQQGQQQAGASPGGGRPPAGSAGDSGEVVDLTAGDSEEEGEGEGEGGGEGEGQPATPGLLGEPAGRKRVAAGGPAPAAGFGAASERPAKRQADAEWREEADGAICILD